LFILLSKYFVLVILAPNAYSTSNELNSVTEKKGFSGLFEMVAYLWQQNMRPELKIRKKRYVNSKRVIIGEQDTNDKGEGKNWFSLSS